MSQSAQGRIHLWNDFFQGLDKQSEADNSTTWDTYPLGDFVFYGQGTLEIDSGAILTAARNGVIRLTTTDETEHAAVIGTLSRFDVAQQGPITIEARVEFNNLDTKEAFIGLSDENDAVSILEGEVITAATETLTLDASDLVGFYLSAELTEDEMWHMVYNGGTTVGETDSTNVESGVDAVAGEMDVLLLEIDPNGTVRWYVNGDLKQTVVGAVSTSVDMGLMCAVETKGGAVEEMDVDFLELRAGRDWTR